MFTLLNIVILASAATIALGNPTGRLAAPTVQLDSGTFVGVSTGVTHNFLGIPFARPPVGNLRFRLPVANEPFTGTNNATAFGPACPQQTSNESFLATLPVATQEFLAIADASSVGSTSEDCLSINVIVPASATPKSKLPIVFWIYGGGFEDGGTAAFNGTNIVTQSILLNQDVIYVSANYRLNGFGFLGGQQVKEEKVGNLGLQDQRLALRWVQRYISSFGGDPTKVIIWGESAGAISVALHLVTNGGNPEGLFRGAFMESGSPTVVFDIADAQQQNSFNFLVRQTGCSGSSDELQCLREAPFDSLMSAINETPNIFSPNQSLNLTWQPRVDGVFLTENPQFLVRQGSVASVPFVTGDCDDEGTLFSPELTNDTTTAAFSTFVRDNFFRNITAAQLAELEELYPNDPAAGSPFGTGDANELFPQFKRLAAFQGDVVFQAPRRFFLQERSALQPTFAFLYRRNKALPVLGSFHSSDLLNIYNFGELGSFLIQFANHLTPNGSPNVSLPFPQYTKASPLLMTLNDAPLAPLTVTPDTFRTDATTFLTQLSLAVSPGA